MWPVDRPTVWVGREEELAVLRRAVDHVRDGVGSVIWVEGEPGIGKSALVAVGVDAARTSGLHLLWGSADQLTQRLPLRVVLDCLEIRLGSPDERRSAIAEYLRHHRPGLLGTDDVVYAAAEMVLALSDELCIATPTVMVFDDLQWADDASLTVWHRLAVAASQLPILLIGICHPSPRRPVVAELRGAVRRRGGTVIPVGALTEAQVESLAATLIGGPPTRALPALLSSAMGNPLYLLELINALEHERRLGTSVSVEPSGEPLDRIPASFTAALNDRLSVMPTGTLEVLRTATLLGREFTVTDLAVVLRRSAHEFAAEVQEAMAAGIVVGINAHLAFRHPLVRQVLYDGLPAALRTALHRDAAQVLAATSAEPAIVAQQLLASGQPGGGWARRWLVETAPVLTARAPELAVELLQREVDEPGIPSSDRAGLMAVLTRTLLDMGRHTQAVTRARQALAVTTDPAQRAEIHWLLARTLFSTGSNDEAMEAVEQALGQAAVPRLWQARLLASLAMFQRAGTGDLDAADATAERAERAAGEAGDTFAMAYGLVDLFLTHAVRRDHRTALECIDRAVSVLGDGEDHADLRAFVLDCRTFTLQNLDRWSDAEETVLQARRLAQRYGDRSTQPNLTAAVLMYWLGRWDDALAELGPLSDDIAEITYAGLREHGPTLLWYGVVSLIAARRYDRALAEEALRAGLARPIVTAADRENSDFLMAARALIAEQDGDQHRAMSILSDTLERRPGEMTLTHQWLPELVRLAIDLGDDATASAAVRACQAEAEAETVPARATAASHRCAGRANRDPEALQRAVTHYRAVGPSVELTAVLEDLAVVLAERGQSDEARNVLNETIERYEGLGAAWDVGRAERRLRVLGVRRGVHGTRPQRAAFGWESLTPTELKVAHFIAEGRSTPTIADAMFLSRRTVQTHISHILSKLDARSRIEIAREAFRQGVGPETSGRAERA